MLSNEKWFGASAGFYPETIDQSLRLDGVNGYMDREFVTPTSAQKMILATWFKPSEFGTKQHIIGGGSSSTTYFNISFSMTGFYNSTDSLKFLIVNGNTTIVQKITNRLFRDPTQWQHLCVAIDTTQATEDNRIVIFVNGKRYTGGFSGTNHTPDQNESLVLLNANGIFHQIGLFYAGANYGYTQGYLADYYFLDGQSIYSDTSATINSTFLADANTLNTFCIQKNGVGIPDFYTGADSTYGNNGFRLTFSNGSALGEDATTNNHNFTTYNLTSTDSIIDSPTNNFCTLNPLQKGPYITLSEGNLQVAGNSATNSAVALGTFAQTSGKWYFEVRQGAVSSEFIGVMVKQVSFENSLIDGSAVAQTHGKGVVARYNGLVRGISGELQLTSTTTWTTGDIIGIAFDMDNGAVYFAKNNTWLNSGDPTSGSSKTGSFLNFTVDDTRIATPALDSYTGGSVFANFGQDSSFAGAETAQGNADANGQGDFYYTPPNSFLALCSSNLSDTTISPNQDTQADDHFNTVLYTANNQTAQSITGVGFQPDWLWFKQRNRADAHALFDTSRGIDKNFRITTDGEFDDSNSETAVTAVGADGFTLGTDNQAWVNYQTDSMVSWNWKAGGSTPTKTYKVVVVSDSGNKYRFRNSADSATFAQSAVTLDLQEGGTYTFDLSDSTMSGHPLRFSTTSDGTHGGGSEYTTGVTTSGTAGSSGATVTITVASSAPTLYYYCSNHSGMGGQVNTNTTFGQTNFDGSILSVEQSNTDSAFSIVTYTANNTAGSTIGHGLGKVPKMVIIKKRSATQRWFVWHAGDPTEYMYLDGDFAGQANLNQRLGDDSSVILPTSSLITLGGHDDTNDPSGATYVAYVFAEASGFSRMGSYTGNGSSTGDGTYVHLGFRPSFIMTKRTDTTGNWLIIDNKRDVDNVVHHRLIPNKTNAEATSVVATLDILSNGFKRKDNNADVNANGGTYIYMAFGDGNTAKFGNSR